MKDPSTIRRFENAAKAAVDKLGKKALLAISGVIDAFIAAQEKQTGDRKVAEGLRKEQRSALQAEIAAAPPPPPPSPLESHYWNRRGAPDASDERLRSAFLECVHVYYSQIPEQSWDGKEIKSSVRGPGTTSVKGCAEDIVGTLWNCGDHVPMDAKFPAVLALKPGSSFAKAARRFARDARLRHGSAA